MKMMRKIIYISILLSLLSFKTDKIEKKSSNLYLLALEYHLEYWDDFYKDRSDLVDIPDVYFIEEDDYTTDSLPEYVVGHRIEVLNYKAIERKAKKNRFSIISIRPAQWTNERFEIHIIDYSVAMTKKGLLFANSGGSSFQVVCDSVNHKLKLKKLY